MTDTQIDNNNIAGAHDSCPGMFSVHYFLTAAECDARGEMPLWLIAERLIEVATCHANQLGIGYADLMPLNLAWVLTRLNIDIRRQPHINEAYNITTWISTWSRHFSERCFRITDGKGETLAFARTIWAAIDIKERSAAELTSIDARMEAYPDYECPVERLRSASPDAVHRHNAITYGYIDLDFNRHVNSARHIGHIVNQWPAWFYEDHRISNFEIVYRQEAHADQTVDLDISEWVGNCASVSVERKGQRIVTANIRFANAAAYTSPEELAPVRQ